LPPVLVRELTSTLLRTGDEHIDPVLQVLDPVDGLAEYFKPWVTLRQLPRSQAELRTMMTAVVAALAADGVTYAELRNSVLYIGEINDVSPDMALGWLVEELEHASELHNVDSRLIVTLTRHEFDVAHVDALLRAFASSAESDRVVGVDLAGDEDAAVHLPEVERFFREARDGHGLGVTIHAGETGSAANVLWAIENCGANRIGHGLAAAESPDLMELLRDTDTCVEVCLTSNLRTGCVRSVSEHPVVKFMEAGVPFVLCTDNPAIHGSTLSDEYDLFAAAFGEDPLESMYARQLDYSFASLDST
jgi:adenosine deaminase